MDASSVRVDCDHTPSRSALGNRNYQRIVDKIRRLSSASATATPANPNTAPRPRACCSSPSAIAEYERAAHPDASGYREGFVAHAKTWAEANAIPSEAFRRMGGDRDVLAAAGLDDAPKRRGSERGAGGRGGGTTAVTPDQIAEPALKQRSSSTSQDLVGAVGGGSPMTVRKALQELISQGKVQSLGPHPSWGGRGRAPLRCKAVAPRAAI